MTLQTGSLFSGYGGLDMAVNAFFGSETAWFVEHDQAPSKILAHHWPCTPNHGDVTTLDWSQVEPVDILTGGFPCQDVSAAGRRAGMAAGTRSGLWSHMAEAVNQLRPRWVVIENVRGLLSAAAHRVEPDADAVGDGSGRPVLRALGAVLGDLADLGYDAQWTTVAASDVGACHRRQRVFIVAHPRRAAIGEYTGEPPAQEAGARSGDGSGDPRRERPDAIWWETPANAECGGRDGRTPHPIREPVGRATATGGGESDHRGDTLIYLPTPTLSDIKTPVAEEQRRSEGHTVNLADCTVGARWGEYAAAISRAEMATGREAPVPTEPSRNGVPRLSAAFAEWMMMLPAGHVTDVGLSRNDQLKAIGNGVCPPQAYQALTVLHPVSVGVA